MGFMGDEKVLKLEKELSQCREERDRLRTEKQRFMMKEREIEQLVEETAEVKAISRAVSELQQQLKTVEAEWDALSEILGRDQKALMNLGATYAQKFPREKERINKAHEKIKDLSAVIKTRDAFCEAQRDEINKLHSVIDLKSKILTAFLENSQENSKITDDIKPFLQAHIDAYIKTLETDDDDYRMLKKYGHCFLQQGEEYISPLYVAISEAFKLGQSLIYGRSGTDIQRSSGERGNDGSENVKG